MQRIPLRLLIAVAVQLSVVGLISPPVQAQQAPRVTAVRMTGGAIQPQVVVDPRGTIHMIFYKGEPQAGDVFYIHSMAGGAGFSAPIRVNSQPGSAVSMGNIRGPQLAVGKDGRAHVVWFGSVKVKVGDVSSNPMIYTRLDDAGKSFEPERNLMQFTYGLDGGGSVAADGAGNVYVAWHGNANGAKGEDNRQIWVARSTDEGKTFSREASAWTEPTGACGCCSVRAFANSKGWVYILYRSATALVDRDIYLLLSQDQGKTFTGKRLHQWKINACPMSSEAAVETAAGSVVMAWETKGQVYFSALKSSGTTWSPVIPAPGDAAERKHPVLATNAQGQVLMAWTEGMGWNQGGAAAWQVYDRSGQPIQGASGRQEGVPVWSLVAAYARPDGSFTVVY